MKVLGHNDVSVDDKAVLAARFFQDLQEKIPSCGRAEYGLAMVAATGNKMQIFSAIIAMETFGSPSQ